jgi:hypothetical protein
VVSWTGYVTASDSCRDHPSAICETLGAAAEFAAIGSGGGPSADRRGLGAPAPTARAREVGRVSGARSPTASLASIPQLAVFARVNDEGAAAMS